MHSSFGVKQKTEVGVPNPGLSKSDRRISQTDEDNSGTKLIRICDGFDRSTSNLNKYGKNTNFIKLFKKVDILFWF